jgi:Predicted endonuclease containing a URI domain
MYSLYILQSTKRKRFYIGVSMTPEKRLLEHNSGSTKSTKPYRPWALIYVEEYKDKSDAMKREWHLKHPKGFLEKKQIIANNLLASISYGGVA